MKTLTEAINSFHGSSGATQESVDGQWGDLIEEAYNHDRVRSLVGASVALNAILGPWIIAKLSEDKAQGLEKSIHSELMNQMCRCVAMGVCIGIEMEKADPL